MDEDNVKAYKINKFYNPISNSTIYQKYEIDQIRYTIILNGKQSDGKYSLIEIEFPLGKEKEIALHKHAKENIIIYVIEGKFSIQKGNENINGAPGIVLKLEKTKNIHTKKLGMIKESYSYCLNRQVLKITLEI